MFDGIIAHTWDTERAQEIFSLYNPLKLVCEDQGAFQHKISYVTKWQEYYDENFDRARSYLSLVMVSRILSQLFSRQSAVRAAFDFTEYDLCLLTRFDLSLRGEVENYSIQTLANAIRSARETGDFSKINRPISAPFKQYNAGYPDFYFWFTKSERFVFENLYNDGLVALKPGSLYEKVMTQGWPDSLAFDFNNHSDPRQFTNIRQNPNVSKDLMKYPKYYVPNVHSLLKFIFMSRGIDSSFITSDLI